MNISEIQKQLKEAIEHNIKSKLTLEQKKNKELEYKLKKCEKELRELRSSIKFQAYNKLRRTVEYDVADLVDEFSGKLTKELVAQFKEGKREERENDK